MSITGLQMHIYTSPPSLHQYEHTHNTERVIQEIFALVVKENSFLSILEKIVRETEERPL